MARLFFLNIVLVLLSGIGYSQNVYISRDVIGSYGGYHQTNGLIVMDNLGEVAVKIDSSSNLVLSQGFEQGDFTLSPVVLPISPPNAFSPDGDGTNDTWIVPLNEQYEQNSVVIFNRWGEIIRQFENYNNLDVVWDGTNINDQQVVTGTYFYVIEVSNSNVSVSGWVQVVR